MLSKGRATEPKVKTDLHSSISSHAGQNVPVQVVGTSRRHHSSDVPAPQEGQALQPQLAVREQPGAIRGGSRARTKHASAWEGSRTRGAGEHLEQRTLTSCL